jgi:hypothetical protein
MIESFHRNSLLRLALAAQVGQNFCPQQPN